MAKPGLEQVLAALSPEERAELDQLLVVPQTFREFVDKANPKFRWYRAHQEIATVLQKVIAGELTRVMIFMPPQEGKSELVTRLLPAAYLTEHPDRWCAIGSYSFGLAKGFSRSARAYYEGVGIETMGESPIADDASAVDEWRTGRNGGLWAVGRGGSAAGKPAHLFIVDDPLKNREEAESQTIRETLHNWYKSVVMMRMQPESAIVIVHTRWHEDDLSGHLLALEKAGEWQEHWTILDFAGVAEEAKLRPKYPPSCTVVPDWRQPGEPLGGRYGMERYQRLKALAGTREYESQIQQRPSAAEGTILKRAWWKFYDVKNPPRKFDRILVSVDCAFKDTDGSDFVSSQVWGRVGGSVYMPERVKARMDYTTTKDVVKAQYKAWPGSSVYVEDKANGPAVINALQLDIMGVVAVNPEGGKVARAYAVQGIVESGRCFLPAHKIIQADGTVVWHPLEWVEEFISECASFPNATHDDDVDACTQALNQLRAELQTYEEQPKPPAYHGEHAGPLDYTAENPARPEQRSPHDKPASQPRIRVNVPRGPGRQKGIQVDVSKL